MRPWNRCYPLLFVAVFVTVAACASASDSAQVAELTEHIDLLEQELAAATASATSSSSVSTTSFAAISTTTTTTRIEAVYRPPDPATIRVAVRDLHRQSLGREPTDEELRHYVEVYLDLDRQGFYAWLRGDSFDVDARFMEYYWSQIGPELEVLQSQVDAQQQQELLDQILDDIDDMISGE